MRLPSFSLVLFRLVLLMASSLHPVIIQKKRLCLSQNKEFWWRTKESGNKKFCFPNPSIMRQTCFRMGCDCLGFLPKIRQCTCSWNKTQASTTSHIPKDTSLFWRTISGLLENDRNVLVCAIKPLEWMQSYHSLDRDQDAESNQLTVSPENLPAWPPVTINEVKNLIMQLKNNKAPGIDHLPPELLKSNIDWWAPLLVVIFSLIDSSGLLPDAWATAIYSKRASHLIWLATDQSVCYL